MEIVLSTKTSNNKQQKVLNQLWRRLNKKRLRNEKLEADLDKLIQVYQKNVLPVQMDKVLPGIIELTERLIVLLSRKSLPQWQRRELCSWICELIDDAGTLDGSRAEQLILRYDTTVAALNGMSLDEMKEQHRIMEQEMDEIYAQTESEAGFENDQDPFGDRIDKYVDSLRSKARAAQNSPNVDMFGFADVDGIIDQTEEQLRGATGKLFEDFDEFEELEDFANDPWDLDGPTEEEIQIDRQWLQKLFRRTARVLHPDRDSNHENYQSRHEAMTALLQARKNQDVVTMISLYAEHVGDGELDIGSADLERITQMLERQEEDLEEKYYQCIAQSPVHAMVYESLYAATRNGRAKKLRQWIQSIQKEAKAMQELTGYLRNLTNLKSALIDRENSRKSMFGMDFEHLF